ncbi:murein hydrolase activator EnvC family protein [Desulfoplanes sp.]
MCASVSSIQKNIAQERDRSRAKREALTVLSTKERKLFKDLAGIEDRVRKMETRLRANEQDLADLGKRQKTVKGEYLRSLAKKKTIHREAASLLRTLWPAFITKQTSKHFALDGSWARAERESTWLSYLYAQTGEKLLELQEAEEATLKTLGTLETAKKARRDKLQELKTDREELLEQRLIFLGDVQKIRSQELDIKEQLARIAGTIKELKYRLEVMDTRSFSRLKGYIPWPAHGRVVKGFRPRAKPPHRGISMVLPAGHPVRAVSWGKVVYDDQLRGFGRVVIIFHGKDYYSLYAFLAQSGVHVGQKVEKGEAIGECGFYPFVKGTGLYFELRFRQKAINPLQWLEPA